MYCSCLDCPLLKGLFDASFFVNIVDHLLGFGDWDGVVPTVSSNERSVLIENTDSIIHKIQFHVSSVISDLGNSNGM